MFKMSIREGLVPEELKIAKVIPIYKREYIMCTVLNMVHIYK